MNILPYTISCDKARMGVFTTISDRSSLYIKSRQENTTTVLHDKIVQVN